METLHYLLMKSHTMFNRRVLADAARIGLTPGRPKILECLKLFGECNQKTIAAYCEIEQATVGTILLGMEKDGLVIRRQKDGNRRSLYVSLTEKGDSYAGQVMAIFRDEEEKAACDLTEDEQKTLCLLLDKLCHTMESSE